MIVGQPRSGKGPGRVVYVLSRRNSVVEQLAALREASPALEVAEAARAVHVRRGATDTTACPALGRLAARLAEIPVKALPRDEAMFHGPDFKLTITHASRPTRQYVDLVEGGDDLAKWCAEIVAAVAACDGRGASE